jgi:hypothetical protein
VSTAGGAAESGGIGRGRAGDEESRSPQESVPEPSSLEGVARDATTILEVVAGFEREGFTGQFAVREGGEIECLTCKHRIDPGLAGVDALRRLEGASDPDDMLAVLALTCPRCRTRGTLLVNYGPVGAKDDAEVLLRLEPPPPPST